MSGTKRRATHAGSWYSADGRQLRAELDDWLQRGRSSGADKAAKAVIAPHAGYRYCGSCAGHCYSKLRPGPQVKRVFILGPSHHIRLSTCAISSCTKYETPLYDLDIDHQINKELMATGEFEVMTLEADEDEHSIEMHLPYVARVMEEKRNSFKIVPILVGSLTPEKEMKYGSLLAKYLKDPENLFVISSDFCHWGQRFRFTHYEEKYGEIHQSIKALDYMGMELIEAMDHNSFTEYLKKYRNTICGRHPIGVFLCAINAMRKDNGFNMELKFVNYDQSNACKSMRDSSVSYAAAVFTIG